MLKAIAQFDGAELKPTELQVPTAEIAGAREIVDPDFKAAAREAHKRIAAFAKAGLKKDWTTFSPKGGTLGEQFTPLDRVGIYVPGGTAPLVSTVLMTVTLAKTAGVPEIVVCTPADRTGRINPYLLFALELAGATEVYRVSGIRPSAMAYGTATVRKSENRRPRRRLCDGGEAVVYGEVALDLVAA